MIRVILLITLTSISVQAQDSTFVKELCDLLAEPSKFPAEPYFSTLLEITKKHAERNPTAFVDTTLQGRLRFVYHLWRALMKSCPNYPSDRVRLIAKPVIDLENQLTEQQIDSLSDLAFQIEKEKKAYVYLVTVDGFYPDSTISDFSNRYRDFWAPRIIPTKGVVLIVFSKTKREIRVSTGDVSMTYLTDDECSEANKAMIPYFKEGQYTRGFDRRTSNDQESVINYGITTLGGRFRI